MRSPFGQSRILLLWDHQKATRSSSAIGLIRFLDRLGNEEGAGASILFNQLFPGTIATAAPGRNAGILCLLFQTQ